MTYTLWLYDKFETLTERANKGTTELCSRACNDLPWWKWQVVCTQLRGR